MNNQDQSTDTRGADSVQRPCSALVQQLRTTAEIWRQGARNNREKMKEWADGDPVRASYNACALQLDGCAETLECVLASYTPNVRLNCGPQPER